MSQQKEEFQQTLKPNGYTPRSWGDIVAIATLLALFIGVLAWGLKLETELNTIRDRQIRLIKDVDVGILPRAEERVNDHERRINRLEMQRHIQ